MSAILFNCRFTFSEISAEMKEPLSTSEWVVVPWQAGALAKKGATSLVMRPTHDKLPIKIELAVVRWANDDMFGIEFIRMKPEQRTRLSHYLHVLDLSHGR